MSDSKWIVILVFILSALVLVEPFDEPVSDFDPRGRVEAVVSKHFATKRKSKVSRSFEVFND